VSENDDGETTMKFEEGMSHEVDYLAFSRAPLIRESRVLGRLGAREVVKLTEVPLISFELLASIGGNVEGFHAAWSLMKQR
jgi:hypothetical protein